MLHLWQHSFWLTYIRVLYTKTYWNADVCLVHYIPVFFFSPRVVWPHDVPCVHTGNTLHTRTPCRHGKTGPGVGCDEGKVWGPLWEAEGTCCPVVVLYLVGPPGRQASMVGRRRHLWRGVAWGCWFSVSPWLPLGQCSLPARVGGQRPAYTGGSCTGLCCLPCPSGSGYKPSSTSVHRVEWPGPLGCPGILSRQKFLLLTRQKPLGAWLRGGKWVGFPRGQA